MTEYLPYICGGLLLVIVGGFIYMNLKDKKKGGKG